jgi:transcriptional regulator with XRE-family HTH domain
MDGDGDLRVRLGQRCRELRKRAGLSQLDLVRHHEFSLSHFQKIERGDLDPRLTTLKKLAVAFRVSLSELVDGL